VLVVQVADGQKLMKINWALNVVPLDLLKITVPFEEVTLNPT
jgi:hypothetical protein